MNGKGSVRRGDKEANKKYEQGWTRIFGKKKKPNKKPRK